jgi:hypothetical protein
MTSEMWRPTASAAVWPKSRSAAAFQLWISPSSDLRMMASSEDSTIEASRRAARSRPGLFPLRAPGRRDVPEDQHAARDAAELVADGRRAVVDRVLAALPVDEHRVVREADDGTVLQGPRGRVLDGLARILVHDPEHSAQRLTDGVRLAPAGQRLGHGIERGDAALEVGGDDRVADAAQRDPQQLASLAGPLLGDPHRLGEGDDDAAREEVGRQPGQVVHLVEDELSARRHERVRAGQVAEDGRSDSRTVPAQPRPGRDRSEQGHERQRVAQDRVEQPAEGHGRRHRADRQRLGQDGVSRPAP